MGGDTGGLTTLLFLAPIGLALGLLIAIFVFVARGVAEEFGAETPSFSGALDWRRILAALVGGALVIALAVVVAQQLSALSYLSPSLVLTSFAMLLLASTVIVLMRFPSPPRFTSVTLALAFAAGTAVYVVVSLLLMNSWSAGYSEASLMGWGMFSLLLAWLVLVRPWSGGRYLLQGEAPSPEAGQQEGELDCEAVEFEDEDSDLPVEEEPRLVTTTSTFNSPSSDRLVRRFAYDTKVAGYLISQPVGPGRTNDPADVARVQRRFLELGYEWMDVDKDGSPGPLFFDTIAMFQNILRGRSNDFTDKAEAPRWRDAVITPGKTTDDWLRRSNAPRWVKLDRGGDDSGYIFNPSPQNSVRKPTHWKFEPGDADELWGTHWLTDAIREAGRTYLWNLPQDGQRHVLINVHELSYRYGGQSGHGSHYNGIDVDVRLPRIYRKSASDVGANTGWKWAKGRWVALENWGPHVGLEKANKDDRAAAAAYDRQATERVLRAFDMPSISKRWLADRTLAAKLDGYGRPLCTPLANHHNHIHIRVGVPPKGQPLF